MERGVKVFRVTGVGHTGAFSVDSTSFRQLLQGN